MDLRSSNLLDEALGFADAQKKLPWRILVVEDCVETSGSFVLHHLIKRSLSPKSLGAVIFIAFSQTFSHYDRILRKLGCNLVTQRDNNRFFFFDMLMLQCPDGDKGKTSEGGLVAVFGKIQTTISSLPEDKKKCITIMIDDISLMEVAANGSSDHVLDFLHYCRMLTSQFDCSLVALNHGDIYSGLDRPTLMLHMEYFADILIKVEPLATGLAADVHGQLTVLSKGIHEWQGSASKKIRNFHFRVKENCVEYFSPGGRT